MHIHCASINVIFDEYSVCYNEKEDPEESSFQKSKTLHDELTENDETEPENCSSPKMTSAGSKIKTSRIITKRHHESQVIGILSRRKEKTNEQANTTEHLCLISDFEPKRVTKVFSDSYWQNAMQEEINQIEKNKTWELVSRPDDKMS